MILHRTARRLGSVGLAAALLAGVSLALAVPASAATGTLTVTTLDRHGASVRSQFGAVDVKTGEQRYLWTGAARRLPHGTYDVFAAVQTADLGADTVGVKRVTVSGSTRVTIDARQGRPVRGSLQPAVPPGYANSTSIWLCDADGSAIVGGGSFSGPAYAIPSSLPDVEMAFSSIWQSQGDDSHATYYAAGAAYRGGVPSGVARTFSQSGLTDIVVRGRTGLQFGDAQIYVRSGGSHDCLATSLQVFPSLTLPYTLSLHVPAGSWSFGQFAQDSIYGPSQSYAARHTYSVTIGAAAWGPAGNLPRIDRYCRCLSVIGPFMFADRAAPSGAPALVSYTLYRNGTAIAHKTIDPDLAVFAPRLPAKGWYLLTAAASRKPINPLPSSVLSPRSYVRIHFYADPGRDGTIGGRSPASSRSGSTAPTGHTAPPRRSRCACCTTRRRTAIP